MEELAEMIGSRVRAARQGRGLTLDQLAETSGVSRRMIVNVEAGTTNASIATLLRLARSLHVSLADLVAETPSDERIVILPRKGQRPLWAGSAGGTGVMVASADTPDMLELWSWTLQSGEVYSSDAHRQGTFELLHVLAGQLTLVAGDQRVTLNAGDAARLVTDMPHSYANESRRPVRFAMTVLEPSSRGRP